MDTYSILREFADSWFLIAMFGFFLTVVARALFTLPKREVNAAAAIPFEEDGPTKKEASDE